MVRLDRVAILLPVMILLNSCISQPRGRTDCEPVLDQTQLVYNGGRSARTLPGYSFWQSFTPSVSGKLVQIEIGFFNRMRGDGNLTIHPGEGLDGERLCSIVASVEAVDGNLSWNSYSVSAMVSQGQKYTFHFVPNPSTLPDPYGVCIGVPARATQEMYKEGVNRIPASLYARGVFAGVDPSGEYRSLSMDSVFKTYVIPDD